MFTDALDFFQQHASLKKTSSKTFFPKLIKEFVNEGFGNPWKPPINIIYQTQ
jgi:hypothetical protein